VIAWGKSITEGRAMPVVRITLPAMLAQRPLLDAAGITFEVVTNHEVLWTITNAGERP
jgi:hypothetical protein